MSWRLRFWWIKAREVGLGGVRFCIIMIGTTKKASPSVITTKKAPRLAGLHLGLHRDTLTLLS